MNIEVVEQTGGCQRGGDEGIGEIGGGD